MARPVDLADTDEPQRNNARKQAGERLTNQAREPVAADSELPALSTNTTHKIADATVAAIDTPYLHIAHATARAVKIAGHSTIGLPATTHTTSRTPTTALSATNTA